MKYSFLFFCFFILNTLHAQQLEPPTKNLPADELTKEAAKIAEAYYNMGWFSGVVLVAEKGKPLFQKSYGKADMENDIPNTLQTKFRIGSINKDYTAVLVLQQVQNGHISLEDKLSKFDLGFSNSIADKITVRNLLNHSSGFADIFIPEYLDNIRGYKNINDILPLLMNEPLMNEPGSGQEYSNYNYIVLGAILEKTKGKEFGQLLNENIHLITGCKNTDYDIAENISGEAKSYRYSVTGKKIDHTGQLEYPTPDGGMYATADDILTFFQILFFTEKLLKNEYKILLMTDFTKTNLLWNDLLNNPHAEGGFAGGGPGVSALVEMNLNKNYFIIVLANTDREVAEEISQKIMQSSKGRKYETPQLPPANYLYSIFQKKGEDYLISNFKSELKNGGYEDAHSGLLNNTGYALLREKNIEDAIAIFSVNVELFLKEANPYDSLAEAYLINGDKTNALKYYKKALEIDPDFSSAKQAIKELE